MNYLLKNQTCFTQHLLIAAFFLSDFFFAAEPISLSLTGHRHSGNVKQILSIENILDFLSASQDNQNMFSPM